MQKKLIKLSGVDGIDSTSVFLAASIDNGFRHPKLYSFSLDNFTGYKIVKQPRTKHYTKKMKPN